MKVKLLSITQSVVDRFNRIKLTLFNGNVNTSTAILYGPFGDDSRPVKDSIAAYLRTEMDGKKVCLGIMGNNSKAEEGEKRLYCTDSNGEFMFNLWLKASGEILIGDSEVPGDYTNFAVRFNELETAFNELKGKHNDLLNEYKLHTHSGVTSGSSATGTTVSTQTPSTANIADSKNEKVKYNE